MYFKALLNTEFLRENQNEVEWNDGTVDKIVEVEVLSTKRINNWVIKIKCKMAIELDVLSVNVWKVVGKMMLSG